MKKVYEMPEMKPVKLRHTGHLLAASNQKIPSVHGIATPYSKKDDDVVFDLVEGGYDDDVVDN